MDEVQSRSTVSVNEIQTVPVEKFRWPRVVRFLVAGMLWLNFLFFVNYREGMKRGYTDFSVFYTAGTILHARLGPQLYDRKTQYQVQENFAGHIPFRRGPLPYIHPPFEALIFVPLSMLSYQQAFVTWAILTVAALVGVALVLRRSVQVLWSVPLWKFVLVSLTFFPIFICLLQGQDSVLLLLMCALALNAMNRGSDVLAGCWFGLGAFKFQFIVPIIVLFFLWKRWRLAVGFAAVGFILALLSLVLVGEKSLLAYPAFATGVVNHQGLGGVPLSLLPNLHGLAMGWPNPLSGPLGAVLAAIASVALFVFAAIKGRGVDRQKDFQLQFSLAIIVATLIPWQTNSHDLSLLVLAAVLVGDYVFSAIAPGLAPARTDLLYPLFPLLISPLWMLLWLAFGKMNLVAIPLLWWAWKIAQELSRPEIAATSDKISLCSAEL